MVCLRLSLEPLDLGAVKDAGTRASGVVDGEGSVEEAQVIGRPMLMKKRRRRVEFFMPRKSEWRE